MPNCTKCKETKDEEEFALRSRGTGRQVYCRECQRQYRRDHYLANKQKYVDKSQKWRRLEKIKFYTWLSTKSCVDCGNPDMRVLEFDHLRDKEFSVGTQIGFKRFDVLQEEIEKCEIVCANCHKIRTATRGNFYSYMRQLDNR